MRRGGASGVNRLRWVGAILAFALLAFPLHAQPAPREASVRLGWQSGWTGTGIAVSPGDTLSIRVRSIKGAANDRPQQESGFNPATGRTADGRQQGQKDSLADNLLKAAARQAILGRIGEGRPFVVGRRYREVVKSGGALSLRWNVPREMAASERGFDVAITVEPAPPPERKPEPGVEPPPKPETKPDPPKPPPVRPEAKPDPPKPADPAPLKPSRDHSNPVNPAGEPAAGTEPVAPPEGDPAPAGQNIVAPVEAVTRPAPEPDEVEKREPVVKEASTPGLSGARLALVGGGFAVMFLLLAAAGVAAQRWRRRKLVNRTRSLLALSPSLDLGEGACRGGSLPAEGPAASLRARLEEGRMRCFEGGEDG